MVLSKGSFTGTGAWGSVKLDGNTQTNWTQSSSTYTFTGVSAGVHTILLTVGSGNVGIASIQIPQLPYQGVAVSGDAVQIVYAPEHLIATSVSVGATNNGATISSYYGEGVIQKLPLKTATDQTYTRSSCIQAGATLSDSTNARGIMRVPIIVGSSASGIGFNGIGGLTLTMSTAATRGRLFTASTNFSIAGYDMASSIYCARYIPCVGVVTATGTGSVLSVGQVVLCIIGETDTGASAETYISSAYCSADLFIVP